LTLKPIYAKIGVKFV